MLRLRRERHPGWPNPDEIDHGTAVLVDVRDCVTFRPVEMEGVVIEILLPGQVASGNVLSIRRRLAPHERRFVVQCATCRVVRCAAELVVVAL